MTIPKDIVEKMKQANILINKVNAWLNDNLDVGGTIYEESMCETDYYEFTDKPTGREQNGGEYCEQHQGYIDDNFYGKYYYPTDNGDYFMTYFDV